MAVGRTNCSIGTRIEKWEDGKWPGEDGYRSIESVNWPDKIGYRRAYGGHFFPAPNDIILRNGHSRSYGNNDYSQFIRRRSEVLPNMASSSDPSAKTIELGEKCIRVLWYYGAELKRERHNRKRNESRHRFVFGQASRRLRA